MNDLLHLAHLVFNNRDMTEKAECTQRNVQETQMIAMALSVQRQSLRRQPFLDQSGPGRPHGPWAPIQGWCILCRPKGHWRKDWSWCVLGKQSGHWQRECPRHQRAMGAPQVLMVLRSEDQRDSRPKVALPRDPVYITNVQPQVIVDVAGCLIEFLIDTGVSFSVLTQRIENLSNHKEYVMGFPGKNRGTLS